MQDGWKLGKYVCKYKIILKEYIQLEADLTLYRRETAIIHLKSDGCFIQKFQIHTRKF